MPLKLRSLEFRAGPTVGAPGLHVSVGSVVVLVGPNGSGKSAALRELKTWSQGTDSPRKVIAAPVVEVPADMEEVTALLSEVSVLPPTDRPRNEGSYYVSDFDAGQISMAEVPAHVVRELANGTRMDLARHYLIRYFTLRLDGRTRFSLADPREWRDFLAAPTNHLVKLFQDDALRSRVRVLTAEAFGLYFVIDPTQQGFLRIRMSERAPHATSEEQSFDAEARAFHSAATLVTDQSDGVQAFVGLVSAVIALPHRILLIDEPEAFLHPPLARRLGATLVRIAQERGASLVVATHSSEFLRGCVEAAESPTVVRLTFERGIATARALAEDDVRKLLRVPLLRSTGALSATFHRAAVVTEADTDRAFYEEVNRRLVEHDATRGIPEAVFLNAQNKQTLWQVIAPLRKLGVPAAAVIDADYLSDVRRNWTNLLGACGVPDQDQVEMTTLRDEIREAFGPPQAAQERLPLVGIADLIGSAKLNANTLIDRLAGFGIFVVPGGGVESWLKNLGITGKSEWLQRIFQRMGDAASTSGYIAPAQDDVWAFLDKISAWVSNPSRLGV